MVVIIWKSSILGNPYGCYHLKKLTLGNPYGCYHLKKLDLGNPYGCYHLKKLDLGKSQWLLSFEKAPFRKSLWLVSFEKARFRKFSMVLFWFDMHMYIIMIHVWVKKTLIAWVGTLSSKLPCWNQGSKKNHICKEKISLPPNLIPHNLPSSLHPKRKSWEKKFVGTYMLYQRLINPTQTLIY
jgi:hypothetical protein